MDNENKTRNLVKTEELYNKLESMNIFQRIFSWKKILELSRKSYAEMEKTFASQENLVELKVKLESSEKELDRLYGDLREVKGEKKALEEEIKKNISKISGLEKSENSNIKQIAELKSNLDSEKEKKADLTNDKKELEKKITSIEKELDQKRSEYDNHVVRVQSMQENLAKEMQRLNDQRIKEEEEKFEIMKKTWKTHEEIVENEIKKLCERNTLEYVGKSNFSTKKKPDNAIKVLDEIIIFDAKSPANNNLDNFPTYILNQAKEISKYLKEKGVKRDAYLVVPTNTLEVLPEKFFDMGEYRVYVITKESIEPIIKSFKKIEEYDTIQEFTPEDREQICQVIGRFAHATKRRVQVDGFFIKEFVDIWKKLGDLPEEVIGKIETFEKSGNLLNPPTEQRKKKISVTALDQERRNAEKELEFVGVNPKIEKKEIDSIKLYEEDKS